MTSAGEGVEKREPYSALLVGMQTGAATMEWMSSSNSASQDLSNETQNTNSKEYMHSYVHFSIAYNSQDWKQPKCPSIEEWIKKTVVHVY